LGTKQGRRQAGGLHRQLHQHRHQALAHFGEAVVQRDLAVAFDHQARLAVLDHAVADAAVLHAAGNADGAAGSALPRRSAA
jgi:hypothetical protein